MTRAAKEKAFEAQEAEAEETVGGSADGAFDALDEDEGAGGLMVSTTVMAQY